MKKYLLITLVILVTLVTLVTVSPAYLAKSNFATGTLTASVGNADTTLGITPAANAGAFPQTGTFRVVIYTAGCSAASSCAARELVDLSLISGATYSVINRARESTTTPSTWSAGSKIQHVITAGWFDELGTAIDSKCTPTTIGAGSGASPTADSLSLCRQALITNYGQIATNVTVTLPTTTVNLGFLVSISTAQTGSYFRVQSAAGGDMYLDGSATGKNYVQFSAPAVGNYFGCFTFQTGAATWKWQCTSGYGVTSTN